jgi:DNA ligase-associated metallophosphoesterase
VLKQRLVFSTHAGDIVLDYRKAAFLPETETLLVADLHFEKASYLQVKGHAPVPAYDTPDTVERLKSLIALYRPKRIAALGDSFHDIAAGERLSPQSYEAINAIIDSVESFIWILGNHDPDIPKGLKGAQEDHVQEGGFLLTHLPIEAEGGLNICGHLHPKVKIKTGRRNFWKACFACSEERIILPSFGTFTGGLDVGHEAITEVLGEKPCYFAISSDGLIGIS